MEADVAAVQAGEFASAAAGPACRDDQQAGGGPAEHPGLLGPRNTCSGVVQILLNGRAMTFSATVLVQ